MSIIYTVMDARLRFCTITAVGSDSGYTWSTPGRAMDHYRYSQTFLNVAHYLLVFCVLDFRPLLIGGLFKLIASLVFACLLAFVVIHSANILRFITARLRVLPISLLPLVIHRRWFEPWHTTIIVKNEPSLAPLFQRPPPI